MHKLFQKNITNFILGGVILAFSTLSACNEATSNTENQKDTAETIHEETPKEDAPMNAMPEDKSQRVSPPDSVQASIGNVNLQINYSKPAIKGRNVWGELVPYGEVWRTGANEATVFQTDKDIFVEGQTLHAGRYALFTIPGKEEWTVIFSNNPDQWGAFKYAQAEDALRIQVEPKKNPEYIEQLTFKIISEEAHLGDVILEWEQVQIPIHIREPF